MHSLGTTYVLIGLILVIPRIPFYFKLIGPNRFCGVKTEKAFESEDNWYKLNRYCAKHIIIWGSFIVLLGLCCFLPLSDGLWVYLVLILPFAAAIPPSL